MKTYHEFVRDLEFPPYLKVAYQHFRPEYEEYCKWERSKEEAESAAKYLDPYNAAVGLFLEYEMGYVAVAQPSNRV